jgi:glycerophosphoryl diester phosphodiesterase
MKTNKKRRTLIGAFFASGFLQSCGGSGSNVGSAPGGGGGDGSGSPVPVPVPVPTGPRLSSFAGQLIYLAHRGSAALYPEETALAYDKTLDDHQVLLECDVQTLADGSLGLMHDTTVDRVTTASGSVASQTAEQWRALDVDANAWHGSNFGDLNALLFSDWVSRYQGKSILVPEDKDLKSMAAMIATLKARNVDKDQVLLQCFSIDPLRQGAEAGYQTCLLTTTATSVSSVKSAGIRYVGIAADASLSDTQAWVASGASTLVWTVNRRYRRDLYVPLGVKGFFSDDPTYLSSKLPLWSTDRFDLQTWVPGMLGSSDDSGLVGRGKFLGNGYWGYTQTNGTYAGCLQGYLCPIKGEAEPKDYSFSLNVRFDGVLNGDQTKWASVFIGVDDHPFSDANDMSSGYHILLRKNGGISIYRKMAGTAAVQLSTISGVSIPDGQEASYRITVTDSAISAARLNGDGAVLYIATAADVSSRGAYMQLGRNGLACGFRRLSVA